MDSFADAELRRKQWIQTCVRAQVASLPPSGLHDTPELERKSRVLGTSLQLCQAMAHARVTVFAANADTDNVLP